MLDLCKQKECKQKDWKLFSGSLDGRFWEYR